LKEVKEVLEEEVVVRQAYQENEGILDGIAGRVGKLLGRA